MKPPTAAELAEQQIAAAEGREERKPDAAEAAQLAELTAEAEQLGVSAEQLRGSRMAGMEIQDYIAWSRPGAVSIADVDQLEAERRARREAEHRRLVERIKAKLP